MKEKEAYQDDIESIRKLMERSVKFISLSGLSGILAGFYALLGALAAYYILELPPGTLVSFMFVVDPPTAIALLVVAISVLLASVVTGLWFSSRKAKKAGVVFWDATAKRLSINLAIPLVTGGLFILILILQGHASVIAPAFLIFYGLALVNASANLYEEVRYLGYSEIILGLLCAAFPNFGLIAWAMGFGVFHIVYGAIMYRKYE